MDAFRSLLVVAGAGALLALRCADAAPTQPPTVEAFGRVPSMNHPRLSPSGTQLAWEEDTDAGFSIVVFDIATQRRTASFALEKALKLRRLEWGDDATLVADLGFTRGDAKHDTLRYEFTRVVAYNLEAGTFRALSVDTPIHGYSTAVRTVAPRTTTPHTVLLAALDYDDRDRNSREWRQLPPNARGWALTLFAVDTRTAARTIVDRGRRFTEHWVLDAGGRPVGRVDLDPVAARTEVLARSGEGPWQVIASKEASVELTVHGLNSSGTAIIASGREAGVTRVWAFPVDGAPAEQLFEDPSRTVLDALHDSVTGTVEGLQLGDATADEIHWLDDAAERRLAAVARPFKGLRVAVVNRSVDGKRMLVRADGPSSAPVYYLIDFATHHADIAGEAYPALADTPLGAKSMITYKARDGSTLPAYLTLPAGGAAKNLPTVVLPHGGPAARDTPDFDWWAQFLASRGYAVLQPQFRGSTRSPDGARGLDVRTWDGVMLDDITDAVGGVVATGVTDPHRVCIVGGSYGGYAALAGAAFTPDLYRCAVSVAGVSDLAELLAWVRRHAGDNFGSVASSHVKAGSVLDPEAAAKSPLFAAGRIKIPVLLIHGADDTVVPVAQSKLMAAALAHAGHPCEYLELPGEDHWLSRSETRIAMLKAIEAFLAKNL